MSQLRIRLQLPSNSAVTGPIGNISYAGGSVNITGKSFGEMLNDAPLLAHRSTKKVNKEIPITSNRDKRLIEGAKTWNEKKDGT